MLHFKFHTNVKLIQTNFMLQKLEFCTKKKLKQFQMKKVTAAVKMFILYFNRYDVINYVSLAALKIEFCFLLQLIHVIPTSSISWNCNYINRFLSRNISEMILVFWRLRHFSKWCKVYAVLYFIQSNVVRCRLNKGPYICYFFL